ncbi:hypothetical protein [Ornithinibacillus californiensis]|nr:hypothetical protein [Ornithinibacillus californiensis]
MKNYLQMHKEIQEKLDRKLTVNEVTFLQWVFSRYLEEKKEQTA